MILSNVDFLETAISVALSNAQRPTETQISDIAERFRTNFPVSDDEFKALIRRLHAMLTIELDTGTAISAGHVPWLNARKASLEPYYWERYRKFLLGKMRLAPSVIQSLDVVSDDILDLAGDPRQVAPFSYKGLIVGEVQSGKTANYIALCCKAADAGYKLIILLTGTIEGLRRQTQERLDHGFAGRDSLSALTQPNQARQDLVVGAGLYDRRRFIPVFTSRASDFSIRVARQLNFSISNAADTILLVCKKNPKVLENLRTWLKTYNTNHNGRITEPLLLLDDEADNASINTAIADKVTRTNSEIRQLLRLFDHSTYIGVTATPFANVFIQPDSVDEMLGDDLFPKDFIYGLEAPSNYIGPRHIFDSADSAFVHEFSDMEPLLPLKHKISDVIPMLPESLKEALRSFLLATTIRDLRDEGPTHRSMLVNISRFTNLHEQTVSLLLTELDEIRRDIRMYGGLPPDEACAESTEIALLRALWLRDLDNGVFLWDQVQYALHQAVQPIVVRAVNQKSGAASLDYSAFADTGLRVIAVGGNSLSRGLTLEGLSTSYFHRNSQMYDTILQMGRWFGYRPGYEDLCGVWMTHDAASWYSHIMTATDELRGEIKRMRRLNLTPRDFGLKVRAHPDSLIVTARNKMRSAKDYVHLVSVSGESFESTVLRARQDINRQNVALVSDLIRSLSRFPRAQSHRGSSLWKSVPKVQIAAFLNSFVANPVNFKMQLGAISEFIARSSVACLETWDVALVSPGSGPGEYEIAGEEIRLPRRRVVLKDQAVWISGSKRRVGTPEDESEGLSAEEIASAKDIATADGHKSIPGKAYRQVRSSPLLLLYLLQAETYLGRKRSEGVERFWPDEPPIAAIGLSFPHFDGGDGDVAIYKINAVEYQALFETDVEYDDDSDVDDDAD